MHIFKAFVRGLSRPPGAFSEDNWPWRLLAACRYLKPWPWRRAAPQHATGTEPLKLDAQEQDKAGLARSEHGPREEKGDQIIQSVM